MRLLFTIAKYTFGAIGMCGFIVLLAYGIEQAQTKQRNKNSNTKEENK